MKFDIPLSAIKLTDCAELVQLQDKLRLTLQPWEPDGSIPANFVRKDGMGKVIAKVDRWVGAYQDPHNPLVIGLRVESGNRSVTDLKLVPNEGTSHYHVMAAMEGGKEWCDQQLRRDFQEYVLIDVIPDTET